MRRIGRPTHLYVESYIEVYVRLSFIYFELQTNVEQTRAGVSGAVGRTVRLR